MEDNQRRSAGKPSDGKSPRRGSFWPLLLIGLLILLVLQSLWPSGPRAEITYDFFLRQLEAQNIQKIEVSGSTAYGIFKVAPDRPPQFDEDGKRIEPKAEESSKLPRRFVVTLGDVESARKIIDQAVKEQPNLVVEYRSGDAAQYTMMFLLIGLPLILLMIMWVMFRRTRDQLMGGGGFLSSFSRSTAKRYEPSEQQTTFNDVAGLDSVKADLQEIVEFLKNPEKFQRLGGRIPKGVLLNGPPGTGKTLLARAIAGEAGVPFFSVNGSEFIQMFVGVGASRVRDLFQTAKENAPSIIFIDEIDAVGRQRGAGLGGGHDEREQTLNQILSEMDGFSSTDSVIVIAATNRPDVLDPALLRPGRFDRHITVGRPTFKGRLEIFKVHTRDVPLDDDVDLERLAAVTIGLTGADIRNLVNEAALWAARNNKTRVSMADFDYARDKVLMGAKREEVLKPDEKEKTAYHEAGHTLAAWFLKGAQRVHKVTIIPRGRSLGSTQIVPSEDRVSASEHELRDELIVLLAGRAAEKLVYDETTVGAENDLERATSMARRMVAHWGMSPKLGPVSYKTSEEDPFLGREIHQQRHFSEHTQEIIDEEVARILNEASEQAMALLIEKRQELEVLTKELLEHEELNEHDIERLIGESVHGPAESWRPDAQKPGGSTAAPPAPGPLPGGDQGEPCVSQQDGSEAGPAEGNLSAEPTVADPSQAGLSSEQNGSSHG
ncbi:MAG: ATP-dependent zinc metalloprotease FtsH 1 [Pirellulaceae bacterium]|nr:MAG: ATP-dependent zinc metalloprotease FtsH 1 [Pirellulaceae bacterium]